jgi:diacylglycerol kinase family enzyme
MTDREVIALLHGSPGGTTEAMAATFGIPRAQLDRLVKAGKARLQQRVLAKPAMTVPVFYSP